ncbi:MAG: hypothetical protein WCW52_08420 [Elusimicrobiales bacterium]|jgi:hypothetical protein
MSMTKTLNFTVLEGFSGTQDNNTAVQLILTNSGTPVRTATFIKEIYTERGTGYEQEVTQLTCSK